MSPRIRFRTLVQESRVKPARVSYKVIAVGVVIRSAPQGGEERQATLQTGEPPWRREEAELSMVAVLAVESFAI